MKKYKFYILKNGHTIGEWKGQNGKSIYRLDNEIHYEYNRFFSNNDIINIITASCSRTRNNYGDLRKECIIKGLKTSDEEKIKTIIRDFIDRNIDEKNNQNRFYNGSYTLKYENNAWHYLTEEPFLD